MVFENQVVKSEIHSGNIIKLPHIVALYIILLPCGFPIPFKSSTGSGDFKQAELNPGSELVAAQSVGGS
jgi:hypothetical protein